MKPSPQNSIDPESASNAAANTVDATLRLIANLPAPEGLAERVQAGLRAEMLSAPRRARVLQWPSALRPGHGLMRSAAAAAIVAVVAGGGWSVYSRVQPIQRARDGHDASQAGCRWILKRWGDAYAADLERTGGAPTDAAGSSGCQGG